MYKSGAEDTMVMDTDEFSSKMRQEVERLREHARTLKGQEKRDLLRVIEILEKESFPATPGTHERERSWAVLIDMLNQIEGRVKEMESALEKPQIWPSSRESAQKIVDQFFYDCQEAEKLIKHYERRGLINREQRDDLNHQLRGSVHTLMSLSRRSDYLTDAVMQAFETRIFS